MTTQQYLNDRAISLYHFVHAYQHLHGRSPTYRQMQKHLGLKSVSTVQVYLNRLKAWGWIEHDPRRIRAIRLTRVTERVYHN